MDGNVIIAGRIAWNRQQALLRQAHLARLRARYGRRVRIRGRVPTWFHGTRPPRRRR